uniref:MD-2-related lipid-recognition domain-containing protein n=1 Tax=Stomoxys calcitrans TaxID=35570 RepID=A0A1I8PPR7_STOCA
THADGQFNKIICKALDPTFSRFELCEVKWNKQKISTLSLTIRLLKVPVTNFSINAQFFNMQKKQNLLISNRTWDACEAVKGAKKFSPARFLLNIANQFTNINHTCPYNHTLIVRNAHFDKVPIPIPAGNYIYKIIFIMNGEPRSIIEIHFSPH